jgi:hypothetical protein
MAKKIHEEMLNIPGHKGNANQITFGETRLFIHYWCICQMVQIFDNFLKNKTLTCNYNLRTRLLIMYPWEMKTYLHIKTCARISVINHIHYSQKAETTNMLSKEWMSKQTVVHPHHRLLLSHEKEQNCSYT